MEEKLRKLLRLIKESGSQEEPNLKEEMLRCLPSILDDAGFNALIILEKPGISVAMVGNRISEEGISAPLANLFTDYPRLFKRVTVEMLMMKALGSEQDEDDTPPLESTIH